MASFHRGVERTHIVRAREYRTPVKTRILAGGVHSAKQQVVRIDREAGWPLADAVSRAFRAKIAPALADCDAVLLSDYGSGLVTPALAAAIRHGAGEALAPPAVPVLARFALSAARLPRPDRLHAQRVGSGAGARHPHRRRCRRARARGAAALKRTGMQAVLVTRGSRGMALFQPKQPTIHVPIFGSDEDRRRDRRRRHRHRDVRRWRWPRARRSTKPRGWRTTPAASS